MSLFKLVVQSNVRRIVRSFGAVVLMGSLVTPGLALPNGAFLGGFGTFGSAGNWTAPMAGEFIGSLLNNGTLPTVLGTLIKADSTAKKKGKGFQFDRIVIKPGDLTVLQGETVDFTATAYYIDEAVAGMDFVWSISEADSYRPETEFRNGRLRTFKPGRFIVKASAEGRYAETHIRVMPNQGLGVARLLKKNENDRSEAERQMIAQWRANGTLTSREISSKEIYSINEERALAEADRQKRERALRHPMNPPNGASVSMSAKPAGEDFTTANADPFPFSDQTVKRTRGPSAGSNDTDVDKDTASTNPAGPAWFRLAEPLGWDSGNWSTADDRKNWVGKPAGATEDVGAGNGNFTLSTPAVSLPGRGIDINLNLNYNSRLWSKSGTEITYNADAGYPAPGWNLGFGRMYYLGSTGGCMLVAPDGTRQSYAGSNSVYNSGGVYQHTFTGYTSDGSFTDYNCGYYSSGGTISMSGSAKLANGTVITYGSKSSNSDQLFPTRITDAHGNYINITYVNNQGPEINTITDTLGRTITFNYNGSGLLTDITGPGYNSTTRTFMRLEYSTKTLSYSFSGLTPSVANASPYIVTNIYYPTTNTGYWFNESDSYSAYGMLTRVIEKRGMVWSGYLSSSGTTTREEVYAFNTSGSLTDAPGYSTLTESWTGNDTGSSAVTSYSVATPADEVITVTRPDGSFSKQTSKINGGGYNDGMWLQTEILSPSSTVLSTTKLYLEQGAYGSSRPNKIEHTDDKSQIKKTELTYGTSYNQVTAQKEYDYGSTLYREKRFTYENSSNYTGRHIFSLVKTVEDYDNSNNRLTRTEFGYDAGTLVEAANVVQHDDTYDPYTTATQDGACEIWNDSSCTYEGETIWVGDLQLVCQCQQYEQVSAYNAATAYRGNLTSVTTYDNGGASLSGAITYNFTYDITGNERTATTNCCQQISSSYSTTTQFSKPDSITKGSSNTSSPHRMTQSFTYDTNTKVPTAVTDFNGLTTTIGYDAVLRPTLVTLSSGGKTTTTYGDSTLSRTELVQKSDNAIVSNSSVYINGRGQVNKTTYQAGASNHNGTQIQYDVMGRQWKVSMPYDTGSSPSNWTVYTYDYLSRLTQQTAPDGSTSMISYSSTKPSSAASNTGTTVLTSDAWGRQRWTRTDAFGRLVEVVEPNPAEATAAVSGSGHMVTSYIYDRLDRLTGITQGSQTRSFKYDSLGRLTQQKLAEQTATINGSGTYVGPGGSGAAWSEYFEYDSRSNVKKRIDARGVTTTFSYLVSGSIDPLNRLQDISYSTSGADTTYTINAAASVSFEYMTTGDKTRVKKVITSGVVTEENTFDSQGRISAYEMKFNSRTSYPFKSEYTYDTAHRLTEVKYPLKHPSTTSRTTVVPSYDIASRITGMSVDGSSQLGNISYNAASQVTQLKTGAGTSHPRIETYGYDSQTGLLTGQTVKNTSGNTTYMDMSYSYDRETSLGSASGKTGQLTKIIDNLNRNRDRLYEFDAIGRLRKAKGGVAAGASGVTANWTQEYSYDRYGNKTGVNVPSGSNKDESNNTVPPDGLTSVSVDAATNRMTTASGWLYDLAGNLIRGQNASGVWQRFEYDAAGRLVKIKNDSNTVLETYTYGATRERLITETTAGRTYYVWGGQSVIAEYTETGSGTIPTFTKSYVYAGSRLLAVSYSSGLLEFHHPDRIGTQLVTFGGSIGTVRQSTYPFGTLEQGPQSNQVFTSYDRSASTGLDYAVNRTYSSGQSRFTQVDPIGMAAASIGNPQSNNMYAYVQNMPTDFVDPSGLMPLPVSAGGFYRSDGCFTLMVDGFIVGYIGNCGSGFTGDPGGDIGGGTSPIEKKNSCLRFALAVAKLAAKYPNALPSQFAKLMWNTFAAGGNFGSDGFKKEFDDGSDQGRHYTGGFWAGFTFGETLGRTGADVREDASRLIIGGVLITGVAGAVIPIPTGIVPESGSNKKDKALNAVASKHGGMLNARTIKPIDISNLIRKEVCE